jgi:hypothetical protein
MPPPLRVVPDKESSVPALLTVAVSSLPSYYFYWSAKIQIIPERNNIASLTFKAGDMVILLRLTY